MSSWPRASDSAQTNRQAGGAWFTTARRLRAAVTDNERQITYDPEHRPEVSNLILIGALASGRDPDQFAADIGNGGASALKRAVTEALNEHLRPIRARRTELDANTDAVGAVLAAGNRRANQTADTTLAQVRTVMQMNYQQTSSLK